MPTRYRPPGQDERLKAFGEKLNRLMSSKGWGQSDLAREATRHVPKTHKTREGKPYEIGRHLIHAYIKGDNEPTQANLNYLAKALGVSPDELLPPLPGQHDPSKPFASATTTLDGKTRLVIDALVDAEVGLKVLALIRGDGTKKSSRSVA